jgi:hypothetical protein
MSARRCGTGDNNVIGGAVSDQNSTMVQDIRPAERDPGAHFPFGLCSSLPENDARRGKELGAIQLIYNW